MAEQRSASDQRPSPEALLAEARREERGRAGRLKIFVGAAPGVGKTYELLQTARAKLKEGVEASMRHRKRRFGLKVGASKTASSCRFSRKVMAFRQPTWSASLTNSIAHARCVPALDSAWRSRAVSLMHGTIVAANRTDRTGVVFAITDTTPKAAKQEKVAA
jgi:hypothetical protein